MPGRCSLRFERGGIFLLKSYDCWARASLDASVQDNPMLFTFGSCSIDCDRRELRRAGQLAAVEPQVFDVLVYLIRHRDRVVSRDDLLSGVWGGRIVSESTLSSRINSARAAIGDSGDKQHWIRTVARKGFRFVGQIHEERGPIQPDETLAAEAAGLETTAGSKAKVSPSPFALPDRPSIAVLPFDGDPELDGFADGLTEDIITGLSRIKALWVIARNTMFTYKGRAIDVRTVGKELGVQYVVNGRVRKAGGRLRMTAQLVETQTGHHVWAAKIDRDSTGLFELQDDLTQFVVASVQVQLIVSESKSVTRKAKPASRVDQLLTRALGRLYQPTADGLREMVTLAERALALDPTNGEACRLLAAGIWHQAYRGIIPWDRSAADRVMMFAQRAVAAEKTDEYSHWVLALAHLMTCHHDRAIVSLRRALDINPSFSLGYGTLGTVLAWGGEPDESIANNELALRINPTDPLNAHRHFGLAMAHYLAARYAKALEHAAVVVELRPDWWLALMMYTASLAQVGRAADAQLACIDLLRAKPDMTLASLDALPFAKNADRDRVADGLLKAGLPAG